MQAGFNITCQVWRFTSNTHDDAIGGSVPSGTIIYPNLIGRISAKRPTQALLEQGLETPNIFDGIFADFTLDFQSNDEIIVTSPPISPHYQKTFRVIGTSPASVNDPRAFTKVTLRYLETQSIQ